jgi:cytochrome c oxidase assembly protein subunit 15
MRRLALASVVANVGIVISGGAVRLTGSGLGCPTWPHCSGSSYVVTSALGGHGLVEFGNRTLTIVLEVIAVLGVLSALWQRPRRRRPLFWAVAVFAGIPAQAVLGGLTVLTDLNPWLVACHFLLSMAVIAAAYTFWVSTKESDGPEVTVVSGPMRTLVVAVLAACAAVLTVGTVVTGSGPHAGDQKAHRTGLDPGAVAQLHADLVFLLVGLTVATWLALRATGAPQPAVRAAAVLLGIELAQGVVGYVQYFTHLPALVVALHMAGACGVWVASLGLWFSTRIRDVNSHAQMSMEEGRADRSQDSRPGGVHVGSSGMVPQ